MKRLLFFCFLCIFIVASAKAQNTDIRRIIDEVKNAKAPDKRVSVFDVKLIQTNDYQVLKGEISDAAAYQKLVSKIKEVSSEIKDSIRLLPNPAFGNKIWGFVPLSVIIVRTEPNFGAEICTQVLMGTPVKILDKKGGWLRIQTPDEYIGWTSTDNIKRLTKQERAAYNSRPKVIVTVHNAFVYKKPDDKSDIVSDVIMGDLLVAEKSNEKSKFTLVSLPDGRSGYIPTNSVTSLFQWKKSIRLTGESLIHLGKQFLGLPYVWGGTSSRGMDCSGFTKTVYFMHSIILPRDASQQYYCGTEIDTQNGFENLKTGDLLFFGKKNDNSKPNIAHVAMYMGNQKFIHASGQVRINSLDPNSPDYDDYNKKRFVGAKRIINVLMNGFQSIFEHPWYKY